MNTSRLMLVALLIGAALFVGACTTPTAPVATPNSPVVVTTLPTAAPAQPTAVAPAPAAIQLPDGTQCLFAGKGATLAFDGKRLTYTCGGPETGLLGDPALSGNVMTVERVTLGHNDKGFFVKDAQKITMEINTVDLADGARCLFAGKGATLAFDGKRLNYTCGAAGEAGLLGDLTQRQGVWTVDRATIGRKDGAFVLQSSTPATVKTLIGAAGPAVAAFTEEMLKNTRYELPDIGAVQLKDGKFEQKYGEGATQVNRVTFVRSVIGDLGGDGAPDAAVVLAVNTGGSGTFMYLVGVLNANGRLTQAGAELIGDRVRTESLAIQERQIVMDLLGFAPNDPMCCPTQPVVRTYRMDGAALKIVSEVKLTPATKPTAPSASAPAAKPAIDPTWTKLRYNPATYRCEPTPAFASLGKTWQTYATAADGAAGGLQAGQAVKVGLRNKFGNAGEKYDIQVVVIAPDGSLASTATTVEADKWADVIYPAVFTEGKPTVAGIYTALWVAPNGLLACYGFEVK